MGLFQWLLRSLLTLGLFRSCWSGWARRYGVGFKFRGLFCFVGRVLVPWVLWSMLSGPGHLLSALALGMWVFGLLLWIRQSCFSFICLCLPLGFRFCYFLRWNYAHRVFWRVGALLVDWYCGECFIVCSFFCYGCPLGHREASKRVVLELAWAVSVVLSGVSCSSATDGSFRSVITGSWA